MKHEQVVKIIDVFTSKKVDQDGIKLWSNAMKNVLIQAAINHPDKDGFIAIKDDLQLTKEALDFLEELQVAIESN